ncbi:MAG: sulfatase [Candidatus Coatesbacteria bacterium]|nr:MAG: sulfatase [Candidatus Coatesbacteria bacterium]
MDIKKALRSLLPWATYVAAVAFFWGATEAFLNYRWPPKGVWQADLWLPSTYNRVFFYAVAVAVATALAPGARAIWRAARRGAPTGGRRWSGAVALGALLAVNAGWLVLGLVEGYEIDVGLFTLDIQTPAWFFAYWGFFAAVAVGLALGLAFALGKRAWAAKVGRGVRLAGAALFVVTASSYHVSQALRPRADGPNVILIVLDAWRADALRPELMPRTYRFGREKTLFFERAWTNATWTLPAMGTMFTGQYHDTNMFRRAPEVDRHSPTLAQILYGAGYETAAFSANRILNRDSPMTDGFEEFYFSDWYPGLFAIRFYYTHWYGPAARGLFHGPPSYRDSLTLTRKLRSFVARPHRRPFFLWVHYMDPHGPYIPPPGYYLPEDQKYVDDYTPWDRRQWRAYKRLYDAECVFMDELLGPLLPRLAAEPRTVVVVTSDHGEEFWEHANHTFGHGKSVYDTLARVPLLVSLPDTPAAKVTTPVSHVDLAPSILTVTGQAPAPTMQGQSFFTPAGGVAEEEARPVYIGSNFFRLEKGKPERRDAVIVWPHKLILYHNRPARPGEYYNLASDPWEKYPLPKNGAAKLLRKRLKTWRGMAKRAHDQPELYGGAASADLRALGYIQ